MQGVPGSRVTDVQDIDSVWTSCVGSEGGTRESTLKGTDTHNVVVKHGCLNSHSCHCSLVQKAFAEWLPEPSLHSLYLWQAKIGMLIIQPLREKQNRTCLQQRHVKLQVNEVLLKMRFTSQKFHFCIWDTWSISLRIYSRWKMPKGQTAIRAGIFPIHLTCADSSEEHTHWCLLKTTYSDTDSGR